MNNVEIKDVPCTQGEDCVAILQKIGEKTECPISPTDLDVVHRVPTKNNTKKNIIARFCCRSKKLDFVSKARKAKPNLNDITNTTAPDVPLYINDRLLPPNMALYSKALALKKEHCWKFLWTDNCQIKARKTFNSKVIRIRNEFDLARIN